MNNFLKDLFDTYKSTNDYKDKSRMEIAIRRGEFEKKLDDMWRVYQSNPSQIVEYKQQVAMIKETGCRVLRNIDGKHKIITK